MKTVGEILKKSRVEKQHTYEDIEKVLKIRKKYLISLENNDWENLPSLPYIKGFIRNYSSHLGLNPEEMIAIFRRQFPYREKEGVIPKGLTNPLDKSLVLITPSVVILLSILLFLFFFFGYLFVQYKSYISPPNLLIYKPAEGEIIKVDKTEVSGKTDSDAVISINDQKIASDKEGLFSAIIHLSPGINSIIIDSTSKNNKKKTITRTVQVNLDDNSN